MRILTKFDFTFDRHTSLDGADYYIPLKIIKVSTPYLSSKKEIAK